MHEEQDGTDKSHVVRIGSKGEAVERARNCGYHKLAIRHKLKL